MRVQPAPRILAVAALCAAALIGLVLRESMARASGLEALLPIEAVDPRSLLQGHYVQLDLVQHLQPNAPCPQTDGEVKWIAFSRGEDGVLTFAGSARSREAAMAIAPVPLRGDFTCVDPIIGKTDAESTPGWVRLNLGITRFHINQTEAQRIEQVLREQRTDAPPRAYAIISVVRDGHARLKGLLIENERLELTW